jgi:hypothetical protein
MPPAELTCDACGALVSDDRRNELAIQIGGSEVVWVHEACMAGYAVIHNARWAFLALAEDPLEIDGDGWVPMRAIEGQRGLWGSDSADFLTGLTELIELRWAEANADESAFRLTAAGERECRGFGLDGRAWR